MSEAKKNYPTRMHEVLGAEPNEEFYVDRVNGEVFYVNDNGHVMYYHEEDLEHGGSPAEGCTVCYIINHPERIIRKPRLTQEQVAQLKALVTLGYRWLIKDSTDAVFAYNTRPAKQSEWWNCGGANVRIFIDLPPGILTSLVSWSDPAPLDIAQVLKDAGVEVE